MKKIAVEEHFVTKEISEYFTKILKKEYKKEVVETEKYLAQEIGWIETSPRAFPGAKEFNRRLLDLGEGRIKEMDEAGIDMEVLSLVSPGIQVFDAETAVALAKSSNNEVAAAIKKYPKRLAAFAAIAPQNPNAAADELTRAVKELGFKGAVINSHTKGEYLDQKKYWPILETAEKLGGPIYLHPRCPSPDLFRPYLPYMQLSMAMWGFAAETGLHAISLICGGIFDQFPRLKIILGHLGESLPWWQWRIDNHWVKMGFGQNFKKKPSQYLKDNFYVDTSGMFSPLTLLYTCMAYGADNIMFAVDHPFESNIEAVKFIDAAPISNSDKDKICHLNAERILGL